MATALQARFDRIYATNQWGAGSGNGSLPVHTHGYIALLERFLTERRIESVIDMGCGDWQFSRLVDWRAAEYRGYDVVSSVIEANTKAFGRPGVSFHGYDGDPRKLPSADLLIVKDVLQHLSDDRIDATLAQLPRYRYALLTNCVNVRAYFRYA